MAKVIKGTQFKYFKFRVERPYVQFGKAVVQDDIFFVLDEETFESLKQFRKGGEKLYGPDEEKIFFIAPMTKLFKALLGDTVEVVHERTGVWDGYGHGHESITVKNPDGSLIYRWSRVGHCEGPGYSCSYSHGPWFEYGRWHKKAVK